MGRPLLSLSSVHPGNHWAHMYPILHDLFRTRSPAAPRPQCLGHGTSFKDGSLYLEPTRLDHGLWNLETCVFAREAGTRQSSSPHFSWDPEIMGFSSLHSKARCSPRGFPWPLAEPIQQYFSVLVSFINNRKNQWLWLLLFSAPQKSLRQETSKLDYLLNMRGGNCVNKLNWIF